MNQYVWKTIECRTCGTNYPCIDDCDGAADGCQATVTENNYLTPGFYSKFDLLELIWKERPLYVEKGLLCDSCIQDHLHRGELVQSDLPLSMIKRPNS